LNSGASESDAHDPVAIGGSQIADSSLSGDKIRTSLTVGYCEVGARAWSKIYIACCLADIRKRAGFVHQCITRQREGDSARLERSHLGLKVKDG
jgi:hypothetical protein